MLKLFFMHDGDLFISRNMQNLLYIFINKTSHGATPVVFIKDTSLTICCVRRLQYRDKKLNLLSVPENHAAEAGAAAAF
jgi:hypothetical protein